jgi:gamma-glutamyltranspeptidase/glutathione hydrolase
MNSYDPYRASKSSDIFPGNNLIKESEETTHYSIVDQYGNAVSVTTTLNGSFGSGVVVGGGGFLLNNEMDDFSSKPGTPNLYGLVGGEANSIQPNKRMLSSMTPTVVEKNGKLFMVLGTPGGSTIITGVFQTILNVIEFNMTMDEAVEAPRFHHQWLPDQIKMEKSLSKDSNLCNQLMDLGHKLNPVGSMNRVDAILIDDSGNLQAGADSRGDDIGIGF